MNSKRKENRLNAGTSKAVRGTNQSRKTDFHSGINSNICCGKSQFQVEKALQDLGAYGSLNAVKPYNLVSATALPCDRALRKVLSFERENGALILSTAKDGGGYYLPSLDEDEALQELYEYYCINYARAMHTLRILRPVRIRLKVINGQIKLPDDDEGGGDD